MVRTATDEGGDEIVLGAISLSLRVFGHVIFPVSFHNLEARVLVETPRRDGSVGTLTWSVCNRHGLAPAVWVYLFRVTWKSLEIV